MSFHEELSRDEETGHSSGPASGPASNRQFALVFIVGWSLIGLAPRLRGRPVRWWAVLLAGALALLWLVRPRWLTPLNRIWVGMGAIMGRVTTPIMTGLLFFLGVTPLAWLYRLRGNDPLARRFDRAAASYWIERRPAGPPPESMQRQF